MIKILFFACIVKPIVFIILGLNIRGKNNLPQNGPAIIAANHNSHLDTLVLISLYPLHKIHKVRPVAAADYFSKNKLSAWFALQIIGIIPIERTGKADKNSVFNSCHQALKNNDILLLFPEGSRGEPEHLSKIKKGIFYLANNEINQKVSITPIIMHGLGRSLPKGDFVFVPFNCDVIIDQPIEQYSDATGLINQLQATYQRLLKYCLTRQKTE